MEIKGGYSLYAFSVALRWAMRKGWPHNMAEWDQEHCDRIVEIAREVDNRNQKRYRRAMIDSLRLNY